jgi:Ca2+-transporting ATPase
MITVHRAPEGGVIAFAKGAPGTLLDRSASAHRADGSVVPLDAPTRAAYDEGSRELGGSALRVLGLAYRELPDEPDPDELDRDWVFLGLVGMMDPLREEARAAVATCREAGIRTVMITGDQPATAAEIGRQLGLGGDGDATPKTVHARELEGLDDEAFRRLCATATVFARVSPRHKLRIVEAMQQTGEIVAMTGDGVNDAPALKKANVGVAMGIKGTDAAKEASAMIVLDDNYATIVAAVEQGRIIYANILRFIHYLFSCNFAEILTVFVALLVGWPMPLGALQILWLNVLTDVFPAMALALEPSSPGMMKRPPRNPHEGLVNRGFLGLVAWQGAVLAAATLAAFAVGRSWYGGTPDGEVRAGTMAFSTLALAQVAHAFSARSQHRSIFDARLFSNGWLWAAVGGCLLLQIAAVLVPPLRQVLHTTPLAPADWAVVAAGALAPVAVVELIKLLTARLARAARRRRRHRPAPS